MMKDFTGGQTATTNIPRPWFTHVMDRPQGDVTITGIRSTNGMVTQPHTVSVTYRGVRFLAYIGTDGEVAFSTDVGLSAEDEIEVVKAINTAFLAGVLATQERYVDILQARLSAKQSGEKVNLSCTF